MTKFDPSGRSAVWVALVTALGCARENGVEPLKPADVGDAVETAGGAASGERPEDVGRAALPGPLDDVDREEPPPGSRMFEPGRIQDIDLDLSADAIDALRLLPTEPVYAQLTWGGETVDVAVRLKGSASFRTIDQKPSFKVDIHAWDPEQRLDGLKRLTLNNQIQDSGMLHEHTYYSLAARMGVPTPRQTWARVRVNGESYGLYSIVETVDEQLMKRISEVDRGGNLYEASGADFTWDRDWFELEETGGTYASPDDVDDVVDAVEGTREAGFDAVLERWFDRDEVLTLLAVDTATGNDDGYVYNHHNYFTWHLVTEDRWILMPWGTDRSFTRDVPPRGDDYTPLVGYLAIACWADATCTADLRSRIEDVLDVWEDVQADAADAADLIADDCYSDPRAEHSCNPGNLLDFLDRRPAEVRSGL